MITEIDKYQVLKELGSGQFGTVYMVLDRALFVQKAIKVIIANNPAEIMYKLDEARILYKCKNNNIVQVNEANIFNINGVNSVVIDMELINGGSIEGLISTRFISVHEVVKIITGVLFGLEHAHNNKIIHRDIKPANILYDGINAKLSDFGLATNLSPIHTASAQGYRQHLAPEVFQTGVTSIVSDIYAAGITLYRVVNNISNWQKMVATIPNLAGAIQSGKLLQVLGYQPYVPKKIISIIKKSTEPLPQNRIQSSLSFRQLLDKLKPGIDWKPISSHCWSGLEVLTRNMISLEVNNNKVMYQKNGRTVNSECRSFNTNTEAVEYMFEKIRDTYFI